MYCLVGSYTEKILFGTGYFMGKGEGIYCLSVSKDGFGSLAILKNIANPSYLALSEKALYAVSETKNADGKSWGNVYAYKRLAWPDFSCWPLLSVQDSLGADPCALELDNVNRLLWVSNYMSGSVSSYAVHEDGSLSFNKHFQSSAVNSAVPRQSTPHIHHVLAQENLLLASDFSGDRLVELLTPKDWCAVPQGSGPRKSLLVRQKSHLLIINELSCSIAVFDFKTAACSQVLELPIASAWQGRAQASELCRLGHSDYYVAAVRGIDQLYLLHWDSALFKLTSLKSFPCPGKTPRHISYIEELDFLMLACQESDELVAMAFDRRHESFTTAFVQSLPSPAFVLPID